MHVLGFPLSQDWCLIPSLPLFLPLSLRLLLPLIIHEMQSQERERERDFMLKHLKKSTKRGGGSKEGGEA